MAPAKRQLIIYLVVISATLIFALARRTPNSSLSSSSSSPSSFFSSRSSYAAHHSNQKFLSSPSYRIPNLPTTLLTTDAGYHSFDSLYLKNGTVYLLSAPNAPPYDPVQGGGGGFVDVLERELLPIRQITSTGLPSGDDQKLRDATAREIRVLKWEERSLLELDERKVLRVEGTTFILNDSGELFLDHYYHMWAELLLGAWKSLTLASDQKEDHFGNTNVEDPRRIMFPHAEEKNWRDWPGLNGYLTKAVFPSTSFEHRLDWEERKATGQTYVFDKAVLVDRTAGSQGDKCGGPTKHYFKMNGNIFDTPGNPNWAQPIRQRLLATLPASTPPTVPVITYISRQGHGRSGGR
ncbi:hypothetical protein BDY24DRAFT_418522 [Mrakia frigida]|uniref:uncharacterized protein n=1 Tax=Mrakia frigida TaxID=29902 RepID=UPI003FCC0490